MQNKQRFSVLIVTFLSAFSLLNCAPVMPQNKNIQIAGSQEATPTTTFYSSYFGLSFDYPSNWTMEEPDPTQFKQPQFPNKPYGYRVNLFPPGEGPQGKYFELGYYRVEITD